MIEEPPSTHRNLPVENISCDLVVVGGGLSGLCCAVTAAREGLSVVLVQDRPVLGGNASSEVRLWILGATSHMGNNNRWAREGGVIDEILVENMARNPEGNPLILDALLLEVVSSEPKIRLLLNTSVCEAEKENESQIRAIRAFCSQNSTFYRVQAPFFCDASGDGVLGFMAGAAFRVGAEGRAEFQEGFAPEQPCGDLLGHSIYFYSKDTGHPVKFVPPAFALKDMGRIPRYRDFKAGDSGCRLWWIEHGGLMDTVHDSERIKWELWQVVYGVWDYIKNSGAFPEADTLTLEWVGTIPGKRESRRFEGDYILSQRDLVEQWEHADAVSYGGWAIDVHPPEGVFSEKPGCLQWHTKGVYQIPYRSLYSRNVENLFLAGRIISASHIAFASTRVMATCAHSAQAVGMAAVLCSKYGISPRELGATRIMELRNRLLEHGQFIPNANLVDERDLVRDATLEVSSELKLGGFSANGVVPRVLDFSGAMMLPLEAGGVPRMTVILDVTKETVLNARLSISSKAANHTPDVLLQSINLPLKPGQAQKVELMFDAEMPHAGYAFFELTSNPDVSVYLSEERLTGVLSVWQKFNRAVAKSSRQEPPAGIGIDAFDFWIPERRPEGKNFAFELDRPICLFGADNIRNGVMRPTHQPNAWVADKLDDAPQISLSWEDEQEISRIVLSFDTDFDHPMESVLMGHPERVMPFCISDFEVFSEDGTLLYRGEGNYQTRVEIVLPQPILTRKLSFRFFKPRREIPAALFGINCYGIK